MECTVGVFDFAEYEVIAVKLENEVRHPAPVVVILTPDGFLKNPLDLTVFVDEVGRISYIVDKSKVVFESYHFIQ